MNETEILKQELDHYKDEKERIRKIIGQIGGTTSKKQDRIINIVFLTIVVILFSFDFLREVFHMTILNIPTVFSIELAVLLISIKIIWMIDKQSKVDHFQFWVLNSIEFQINAISKRMRELEDRLENKSSEESPQ